MESTDNKLREDLDLPRTPICTIESKLEQIVSYIIDNSAKKQKPDCYSFSKTISTKPLCLLFIRNIKALFDVEIRYDEVCRCEGVSDVALLIKRKMNTIRMMKTEKQYHSKDNSVIPEYHSEFGVNSVRLDRIAPFNDFFCKSCFFNAFYSILPHFDAEAYWFLSREIYEYSFPDNRLHMNEIINCHNNIVPDFGFRIYRHNPFNNPIETIKKSLQEECPAILTIDPFYCPNRDDTYLSDHTLHNLFIFGYDDKKQIFYIVDHDYYNDLQYKKTQIPYQDLYNAFYSFYKWFGRPRLITVKKEFECPYYSVDSIRNEYIAFCNINKDEIILGIASLLSLKEFLQDSIHNKEVFVHDIGDIIAPMDTCIILKYTEAYLFDIIFSNTIISDLQLKIRKKWQEIVLKLRVVRERKEVDDNCIMSCTNMLESIYNMEVKKINNICNYLQ